MSFEEHADALASNIQKVVRGKPEVVRLVLTCLFAEGHVLIEDVPGVGKTTIARALAQSIAGSWGRIQFTPDLLPADVTGTTVYDQESHRFDFHQGPVFANILVADEINRASPKTQSALLQVMEERKITVDGTTYPVPRPFVVVATQNPIEMDGTYRLPEAQLDRFLMRVSVDYPSREATREIMQGYRAGREIDELGAVMSTGDVQAMIDRAAEVHVADQVHDYIIDLAERSRVQHGVRVGVSPRGCLALMRAARARAAIAGRAYAIPEDVKELAHAVLGHRLILTPQAELESLTVRDVIDQVLAEVPVPHEPAR